VFPYEQLKVYQKAYEINQKLYRLLKENRSIAPYIKNQLGRAGLSTMLNIAEGNAKYSLKDRRNFFIIARGSAFETASLICFLHGEGELTTNTKNEFYSACDEICRMLYAMIRNLEDKLK
jgi:four helix bundle protein